jgi:mono/diheme cytochrome c family protein
MTKLITTAAMICAGTVLLLAQAGTAARSQATSTPKPAATARAAAPSGPAPGSRVAPALQRSPVAAGDAKTYRAFVNQYCVGCHNTRNPQPAVDPVDLEKASLDDVVADAVTWERVLRKLSVRAMPPQGMPHPPEADYVGFTTWLANSLDRAWASRGTSPGRYVVHRLNRTEYGNAVRDLLAIDVDVTSLLPSDDADFGFDNIAASLKTSPMLLDRYVTAAQRISTLAIGNPKELPGTTEYSISREFSQNAYIEGLPLGTRGGTVVRHIFPADGEYRLATRLFRGVEEGYVGVEGNDTPHTFVITIDGDEVFSTTIGGPKDHEEQAKSLTDMQPIVDARLTTRVKVKAGPHDVGFTWRERPGQPQDVWQPALRDSQEIHMVGGMPKIRTAMIEGPYNVTGVSATPSRDRIFVCRPASAAKAWGDRPEVKRSPKATYRSDPDGGPDAKEEASCATRIFTNLTRRAYRQPVTGDDVQAPLAFYRQARQNSETFDAGIRAGLARVLSSPSFLYRMERDAAGIRPGAAHPVSDVELASRLSFFLWSSIPDERLLSLATSGRLRQPGVLGAQVKRMIGDERSDALIGNFTGQWLQLRNLEAKVAPDLLMFPDFDDNIRKGFRRETEMLFSYILRNDRSALELLSADYTFINERLAKHYGIPGVYGERFRQIKLTDPNRFGLLGHGSILSLTALATRTSPVFRGTYVLTTFLNTPPPPPPPNVPALEDSNKAPESAAKSVRDQLELHRQNPACAGCHRVIDPPGFALENFNSVGQWRGSMPNGAKIDANGVLADGSRLNGPVDLRQALVSRPEAFVTVITQRMMIYALGRGLEPADMPVVRRIVRKAGQNGYRLSTIVNEIIESAPFQMRTRLEPAQSSNTVARTTVE